MKTKKREKTNIENYETRKKTRKKHETEKHERHDISTRERGKTKKRDKGICHKRHKNTKGNLFLSWTAVNRHEADYLSCSCAHAASSSGRFQSSASVGSLNNAVTERLIVPAASAWFRREARSNSQSDICFSGI